MTGKHEGKTFTFSVKGISPICSFTDLPTLESYGLMSQLLKLLHWDHFPDQQTQIGDFSLILVGSLRWCSLAATRVLSQSPQFLGKDREATSAAFLTI